jgi:hypothetical protein
VAQRRHRRPRHAPRRRPAALGRGRARPRGDVRLPLYPARDVRVPGSGQPDGDRDRHRTSVGRPPPTSAAAARRGHARLPGHADRDGAGAGDRRRSRRLRVRPRLAHRPLAGDDERAVHPVPRHRRGGGVGDGVARPLHPLPVDRGRQLARGRRPGVSGDRRRPRRSRLRARRNGQGAPALARLGSAQEPHHRHQTRGRTFRPACRRRTIRCTGCTTPTGAASAM